MERTEVFDRLREQMADMLEVDQDDIKEESLLVDDLDADSIDLLDLVLILREAFDLEIDDNEVKSLLVDLARFLPELGGAGGELSDERLVEVSRRLRVGMIVDFIMQRTQIAS